VEVIPKPTSRNELVRLAATRFEELCALCDSMSEREHAVSFDFSGGVNRKEAHWRRDKNVRDVLTHLYEWHQLLLTWVRDNRNGRSRPFLPPPHNWRTYGKLNEQFWLQHQSTALGEAKRLVRSSHEQVMALINSFSEAELFEKDWFAWTGTTTLGSYCTSATSSHYDWALRKIRAHLKELRSTPRP